MADLNNKEKAQRLQDMYEAFPTIEGKLGFLVENASHFTAVEGLGKQVSAQEVEAHQQLVDKFIQDYIVKGDSEKRRQAYESLGKLITSNNEEMYWESQRLLQDIPQNVQNREKAAYWLARNSSQSGVRLSVLNDLTQQFDSSFTDVPDMKSKKLNKLLS